jgi:hypothetical protein
MNTSTFTTLEVPKKALEMIGRELEKAGVFRDYVSPNGSISLDGVELIPLAPMTEAARLERVAEAARGLVKCFDEFGASIDYGELLQGLSVAMEALGE